MYLVYCIEELQCILEQEASELEVLVQVFPCSSQTFRHGFVNGGLGLGLFGD